MPNVCGGRVEPMQQVCGGGFCWENPLPTGSALYAAKTSPSGTNWVAGASGTVLKWDGTTWSGWFAITDVQLNAVWPFSDSDVWVAGAGGKILHWDGVAWAAVASGTTQAISGLWGAADGTLWAVGSAGVVLKRPAGGSFAAQAAGTTAQLNAVFGVGPDLWAVGNGTILRFNGTAWSTTTTGFVLRSVWGASPTDVWAASNGAMLRFNGSTWAQSTSAYGQAVFGTSATNVWVVDATSNAFRFDGLAWTAFNPGGSLGGSPLNLFGLTGSSPNNLLAVGASGAMYRFDGQAWWPLIQGVTSSVLSRQYNRSIFPPVGRKLAAVSGGAFATVSYQDTFTCCFAGLLTRSPTPSVKWSFAPFAGGNELTGTSSTNLWSTLTSTRSVARFDGVSWSTSAFSTAAVPGAVVTSSSNSDAWVVGRDKTFHFVNGVWTQVSNPLSSTTTYLHSAATADSTHVWAGGATGTMLFYDGTSWATQPTGVTGLIAGIRANSPTQALAWGAFGVIRWNGTSWGPTLRTTSVTSAWAEDAMRFWVLNASELKRWDGAVFVDMAPWLVNSNIALVDLSGTGTELYLLGSEAEVLKKVP